MEYTPVAAKCPPAPTNMPTPACIRAEEVLDMTAMGTRDSSRELTEELIIIEGARDAGSEPLNGCINTNDFLQRVNNSAPNKAMILYDSTGLATGNTFLPVHLCNDCESSFAGCIKSKEMEEVHNWYKASATGVCPEGIESNDTGGCSCSEEVNPAACAPCNACFSAAVYLEDECVDLGSSYTFPTYVGHDKYEEHCAVAAAGVIISGEYLFFFGFVGEDRLLYSVLEDINTSGCNDVSTTFDGYMVPDVKTVTDATGDLEIKYCWGGVPYTTEDWRAVRGDIMTDEEGDGETPACVKIYQTSLSMLEIPDLDFDTFFRIYLDYKETGTDLFQGSEEHISAKLTIDPNHHKWMLTIDYTKKSKLHKNAQWVGFGICRGFYLPTQYYRFSSNHCAGPRVINITLADCP